MEAVRIAIDKNRGAIISTLGGDIAIIRRDDDGTSILANGISILELDHMLHAKPAGVRCDSCQWNGGYVYGSALYCREAGAIIIEPEDCCKYEFHDNKFKSIWTTLGIE